MAIPLAVPVVAIVALIAASASSPKSSGGGGGGGGGGGADTLTCAQAIDMLPETLTPGGGSIKTIVVGAMLSTILTADQLEAIAVQLDRGATDPTNTDPKMQQAFRVAAACVRARKATAGSPPPIGPSGSLTCEQAFAGLPTDLQKQILDARTTGTTAALEAAAKVLDATALVTVDPTVRDRLQTTARCLRAGGSGDVGGGKGTDAGGAKGVRSSPNTQWYGSVEAAPPKNSASAWTTHVFGTAGWTLARQEELINNNNPNDANGIGLGPVSRSWPPGTPGQTNGVLNWTRLPVGARLAFPKSWNPWIDQLGNVRGGPTPFPVS